jgi:hypothetical protein
MLWEGFVTAPATALFWYADGLRFSCTQCGNCCSGAPGYVWIELAEVAKIAAFVGVSEEQFARQHVRRVSSRLSLLERSGGDCEFLDRNPDGKTTCRIHPVRPVQCRTWPFWKSNLTSARAWETTAKHCPGMNAGDVTALPVIQACLRDNGTRPL